MDWMSLLQLVTSAAVILLWRRVLALSRQFGGRPPSAPVRRQKKLYPPLRSVIVTGNVEDARAS